MQFFRRLLTGLFVLVAAALLGAAAWLWAAPPDLIRIAAGYTAKIVCSNVFLADRDAGDVLKVDVQAPGHPILRLMSVDVDRAASRVDAALFGIFGRATAVARTGLGCTLVPDGDVAHLASLSLPAFPASMPGDALWPEGSRVETDRSLQDLLDDPQLTGPGFRAAIVVENGRIVGERYADGFTAATPLVGWSMTKTVTAAIVGTLVADGRLSLDRRQLLPEWRDERRDIALADLLGMVSGLAFNEDYGDVTDVTRMLYLEPDMAAFAAAKPLQAPIGHRWHYSSGTSVILSRIWQRTFDSPETAMSWPRRALFEPLGMTSAVLETDESGTPVGASYLYATARDWARFGAFLLEDGVWNGRRILPPGYVAWMREPVPPSDGRYGKGQVFLKGPDAGDAPGADPDAGFTLPTDLYWMIGHDGQSLAIVPSRRLAVLRLGLTPWKLGYKPQRLVQAVVERLD